MTRDEVIKKYGNKIIHEIGDKVFVVLNLSHIVECVVKARVWYTGEREEYIKAYMLLQESEEVATNPELVFDNFEDALEFQREFSKAGEEARDA